MNLVDIALGVALGATIGSLWWLFFILFVLPRFRRTLKQEVVDTVKEEGGKLLEEMKPELIKTIKVEGSALINDFKPKLIEAIKKEAPKLLEEEGPKMIREAIKEAVPKLKAIVAEELPLMMEEQAPKLIETFLKDISERVADPEEEQTKILLSTMAFQGMGVFRACMQDPDFKRDVDDYIRGKTNMVRSEIEKSLPGILVKAAPEIKKAFLGGGGGAPGEGGDPTLGFLGMFIPPEFRQMLGGGQ